MTKTQQAEFDEFYRANYAALLHYIAFSYVNLPHEDCDEAVASAFVKLHEHYTEFNHTRGQMRTFLYSIAKNKALDAIRRRGRHKAVTLSDKAIRSSDVKFSVKESYSPEMWERFLHNTMHTDKNMHDGPE